MITKYITEGRKPNKDLYDQLFEDANTLLGLNSDTQINNLEEYFDNLNNIINEVKSNPSNLCHYLRLPVDEPYFEINANNRTITVPSVFAISGVGVQGEVGVETIYFQIDRYFDTVDLSTTNIQILYKTKDNSFIENIFMKEVVDEKLVFGWPIPEQITNTSGKIKIAIRFVKTKTNENDEEEIIYNFSTLPTEISIKSGLFLTNPESINNKNFVLERFGITTEEESPTDENPTE